MTPVCLALPGFFHGPQHLSTPLQPPSKSLFYLIIQASRAV